MKALVLALITVIAFVYPLFVYLGINQLGPAIFSLGLMVFSLTKLLLIRKTGDIKQVLILLCLAGYSGIAALSNSEWLLRLYPAIICTCIAGLFALSYFEPDSLIEKMAKMAGKEITPNAKRYTRKLTMVWAGILLLNALLTFYLAIFASLKTWAFYCGFMAYFIFAVLFLLEFLYRQYYIKKYGA